MFKLSPLLISAAVLIGTLNPILAMDKVAESPQAIVRKYMVFREGANNLEMPREITWMIGQYLNQLNKLKIEVFCPSTNKVTQEFSTALTLNVLERHLFEESGTRYSIQGAAWRSLEDHPITSPIQLISISVMNKNHQADPAKTSQIKCTYIGSGNWEEFQANVHPLYPDGSEVNLATYAIKIVENESAPADAIMEIHNTLTIYSNDDLSEIAPTDVKFVLTPK